MRTIFDDCAGDCRTCSCGCPIVDLLHALRDDITDAPAFPSAEVLLTTHDRTTARQRLTS